MSAKIKIEGTKAFLAYRSGMKVAEYCLAPEPEASALVLLKTNAEKGVVIKHIPRHSTSVTIKEYGTVLSDGDFELLLSDIMESVERFLDKKRRPEGKENFTGTRSRK